MSIFQCSQRFLFHTSVKLPGSIECELDEIESIIVDEEGYIELLCNIIGYPDYIWKTPINMKLLCAE